MSKICNLTISVDTIMAIYNTFTGTAENYVISYLASSMVLLIQPHA